MKPYEFLDHMNAAQPEYIKDAAPKKNRIRTAAPDDFAETEDQPARGISMTSSRALVWSARAAVVLLAVGIGTVGLKAFRAGRNMPVSTSDPDSSLIAVIPADSQPDSTDITVQSSTAMQTYVNTLPNTGSGSITAQTTSTTVATTTAETGTTSPEPIEDFSEPLSYQEVLNYLGISENELTQGETGAIQGVSPVSLWLYEEHIPEQGARTMYYHNNGAFTFYIDGTEICGLQSFSIANNGHGGLLAENRTFSAEELKTRAAEIMQHLLPQYSEYSIISDEERMELEAGLTAPEEVRNTLNLRRTIPNTAFTQTASIKLGSDGSILDLEMPAPGIPASFDADAFEQEQSRILNAYSERFRTLHPDHRFSIAADGAARFSYCAGTGVKTVKCKLTMDDASMNLSFSIVPGYQISAEKLDAEINEEWTEFCFLTQST